MDRGELHGAILEALLQHADVGVTVINPDLRYLEINAAAAAQAGATRGQIIGRHVLDVAGKVGEQLQPPIEQVLATATAVHGVEVGGATLARPDRPRHWVCSFLPLMDGDSSPAGVAVVSMEVTDKRELEQRVRRAADEAFVDAAVRERLATEHQRAYERSLHDYEQLMRHRIANPLTVVRGLAQTLRDYDELDGDTREQVLAAIDEQSALLEQLALAPRIQSPEERELCPSPAQWRQERLAFTETIFRDVNERLRRAPIVADGAAPDDVRAFVCECSDLACAQVVYVRFDDYRRVRGSTSTFMVAPGHDTPEIENVIEQADHFHVVEKPGV
jgi:signal transduction histidine kinase